MADSSVASGVTLAIGCMSGGNDDNRKKFGELGACEGELISSTLIPTQ